MVCSEQNSRGSLKARLLFPLLSMLDVSSNLLRSVPPALHLLTNLAVLNLSGNKGEDKNEDLQELVG